MSYKVHTPVFEGPFDLLLHLITKDQVELWDISISEIVDGYVRYLEEMADYLDLETATEFLLIAAILLELKANRLLPEPDDLDLDDELARCEERDLLVARLLECKTFKDASAALVEMMDQAERSWPRQAGMESRFAHLAPDPLEGVNPRRLRNAALRALSAKPEQPRVAIGHIHQVRFTVADAVRGIARRLELSPNATFVELTDGLSEPMEIIVHFLALLEMCKQGSISLEQAGNFAELRVSWSQPELFDPEFEFSSGGEDL